MKKMIVCFMLLCFISPVYAYDQVADMVKEQKTTNAMIDLLTNEVKILRLMIKEHLDQERKEKAKPHYRDVDPYKY